MYTNIKTSNRKKLWLKALVDSGCTHTGIDKQLVKQIKMKPIDKLFKVLNTDGTKNREIMRFILLELEVNRHIEKIDVAVTDLNSIDVITQKP